MAPKVVDVDPDGTDSETDTQPSESQLLSARGLDEAKSNEDASTPVAPAKLYIQEQEQVDSVREVSEQTEPMLMSTQPSATSNALFAEQEMNHSSDEDVNPDLPLKSCSTTDHPSETNTVLNFTSSLLYFEVISFFLPTCLGRCAFIVFVNQQTSVSSFNFYGTNSSIKLAVLKTQQSLVAKKVSFLSVQCSF